MLHYKQLALFKIKENQPMVTTFINGHWVAIMVTSLWLPASTLGFYYIASVQYVSCDGKMKERPSWYMIVLMLLGGPIGMLIGTILIIAKVSKAIRQSTR